MSIDFSEKKVAYWSECIGNYLYQANALESVSEDAIISFRDTLSNILDIIAHKVAPRDNWEMFYMSGINPIICSDKFSKGFILGTYLDLYFYLDVPIHYPRNIYRMTDKFWGVFLELHRYGKLNFEEGLAPNIPGYMKPMTKNTSQVSLFRLIQNYISLSSELDIADFREGDALEDFGSIEVKWPVKIEINDFLNNLYEAFKRLYNLNNMLYRQEYISQHYKMKRANK